MSLDAHIAEERGGPAYARCRRRADGCYTREYFGRQRAADPWNADEAGAVCVIDLLGEGRLALYDTEDRQWMCARLLP